MRIYKAKDRIKIKVDKVTISISPLSYDQKVEVQDFMLKATTGDIKSGMEGARLAIKYAVKTIKGVTNADGSEYSLELENNSLTDECVEDLTNSEMNNKLTIICCSLLGGITKEFIDPTTKKKLEGVSVLKN